MLRPSAAKIRTACPGPCARELRKRSHAYRGRSRAVGKRSDLGGLFLRSSWEANYARYLNLLQAKGLIQKWEYEPETFWFEGIRRGTRSYTPDFRITDANGTRYVEVKGYMDQKSRTKLRRMAKYHPGIRLDVVAKTEYTLIKKAFSRACPGWE